MPIPRRLRIFPAWIATRIDSQIAEGGASFSEMLRFLLQPSESARGQKYIESSFSVDDFLVVKIKNFDRELYYPNEHSFSILCATLDEGINESHGHQFLIPEAGIEKGDFVIDCGTAEGFFALKAVDMGCQVHAFEPVPRFIEALKRTFEDCDKIKLWPYGVSRRSESVSFDVNETASKISEKGLVKIELKALDDILLNSLERFDFLKADIEGFEYEMLLGAEGLIRKFRPKIAVTVYHEENNSAQIERFLKSCHSDYCFKRKGLALNGQAIMLHAW